MRRLPRTQQLISRLLEPVRPARASVLLCRDCQKRAASLPRRAAFSSSASRPGEAKVPFVERVRQRIWGTEQPAGQLDPYSEDSPLRSERREILEEKPEADDVPISEYANVYEPATTWSGLEWVGSKEWIEAQGPPRERFRGFLPEARPVTAEEIESALRRTLVEVFALREAQFPLKNLWHMEDVHVPDWTINVQIRPLSNGHSVALEFPSGDIKWKAWKKLGITGDASKSAELETLTAQSQPSQAANPEITPREQQQSLEGRSWKSVSLQPPSVKFAVVKRVMQLTGIRTTDPMIQQCDTAETLLHKLIAKPKPKKLAEALASDKTLARLHNVRISERRITPIDREKDVGRWKVIEQELTDRSLPVTGH